MEFQSYRLAGATANDVFEEEFKVPDGMVGLIIGRGGEQIARLQTESECNIWIPDRIENLPHRPCLLTGTKRAIQKAKDLMNDLINRGTLSAANADSMSDKHTVLEMMLPGSKVGLVIGKRGETIRNLQKAAGVKMLIQTGSKKKVLRKLLTISGKPEKCKVARKLVLDLISGKPVEVKKELNIDQGHGSGNRNYQNNEPGGVIGEPNVSEVHNTGSVNNHSVIADKGSKFSAAGGTEENSTPHNNADETNLKVDYQSSIPVHVDEVSGVDEHSCEFCKKGDMLFQEITQLLQNFFNRRQFKCKICNRNFLQEKNFIKHLKTHKEEQSDETCISYGLEVQKQVKLCHKEKNNCIMNCAETAFKCQFCPRSFVLEVNLSEHTKMHQKNVSLDKGSRDLENCFNSRNVLNNVVPSNKCNTMQPKNVHNPAKEVCEISSTNNTSKNLLENSESPATLQICNNEPSAAASKGHSENLSETVVHNANTVQKNFVYDVHSKNFSQQKCLIDHPKKHKKEILIPKSSQSVSHQNAVTLSAPSSVNQKPESSENLAGESSTKHIYQNLQKSKPQLTNEKPRDNSKLCNSPKTSAPKTFNDNISAAVSHEFSVEEFSKSVLSQCQAVDNNLSAKTLSNVTITESIHLQRYTCKVCSLDCFGSSSMLTHFLSHIGDKTEKQKNAASPDDLVRKENSENSLNKLDHEGNVTPRVQPCAKKQPVGSPVNSHLTCNQAVNKVKQNETKSSKVKKADSALHNCRICLLSFKTLKALNKHTDEHFISSFPCHVCDKTFIQRSQLYGHLASHAKRQKMSNTPCVTID